MAYPSNTAALEHTEGSEQTARLRHRSGSLIPGSIAKPRTATMLAALILAMVAALVGPLGTVPSAQAADGNPTFKIGEDGRWGYYGFINQIRAAVDDPNSSSTVANSTSPVDHTVSSDTGKFFQVDVKAHGGAADAFVRLQIRKSDLYIVGWWSSDNWYNVVEIGGAGPSARWQDGVYRGVDGVRNTAFRGDYGSLEKAAGVTRNSLVFNHAGLNAAVWDLLGARGTGTAAVQAKGILRMTQFVSEATRFKPISNLMANATDDKYTVLDWRIVGLETSWGSYSSRFNFLQDHQQSDVNPLRAWAVDWNGALREITLWAAANYADWILNTAKGT
ncbi:ribosome-inactivating family protein [Streptomyces sp. NPDC060065]|uniref:ribosome-inactivating family protein n=1 Tax=Streptomyces sp. NPDC060065 TaxID=3347050 RepID=UPI00367A4B57